MSISLEVDIARERDASERRRKRRPARTESVKKTRYSNVAFTYASSCECTKSELALSVPPTQTSIESGTFVEYHPISSITGLTPIEFDTSAGGEDYMDLANSYLFVNVKIQRADGVDLAKTDDVWPANNFLHSTFSQIDIQLNGTLVSSSSNTYPYRAYIESMLS